ncbi:MAG: hypothetical protein AAF998_15995 [Bacteroidota bacterium]
MRISILVSAILGLLWLTGCAGDSDAGERASTPTAAPTPTPQPPGVDDIESATDAFAERVFPDFSPTKMDPMDAFPRFQAATGQAFRRLQRKQPIDAKVGRTYPRILLKSYRFPSAEDLEKEVTLWLNGLENSADTILLGRSVAAVKTPPLLCGIAGTHFWMVQSACIYETGEWEADQRRFRDELRAREASYVWEVKCGGGELVYHTAPDTD